MSKKRFQNRINTMDGKASQALEAANNVSKKHNWIATEMIVRGWLLFLLAVFWDLIAEKLQIRHAPGYSWLQLGLMVYGIYSVYLGNKSK